MTTVNFAEFKARKTEEEISHSTGSAKCLACNHEWEFAVPTTEFAYADMECPSCHCFRGKRMGLSIPKEPHWVCACGNDLFLVTKDIVWCPHCATEQNFGKE